MISKTYILQNLQTLEKLYNSASSQKKALFYSKLAILELCGWIEESMDDIAIRCANRNLNVQNRLHIKKEIISKVFGFKYTKHFRPMLMSVVGLIIVEEVEKRVDQNKLQIMISTLGTLSNYRNLEAHTHIKGVTRRLDSPSVTINNFINVFAGLKNFDIELRCLM